MYSIKLFKEQYYRQGAGVRDTAITAIGTGITLKDACTPEDTRFHFYGS